MTLKVAAETVAQAIQLLRQVRDAYPETPIADRLTRLEDEELDPIYEELCEAAGR